MNYEWYEDFGLGSVVDKYHSNIGTWAVPYGKLWFKKGMVYPYGPSVVRYPKKMKPQWEKLIGTKRKIERKNVPVVVQVEIRPVMVCGWCGGRIKRGAEEEPCEYCGC